jgi:hypothetical protein
VVEVGFVPCRLRPDGWVVAVNPRSDEGREVIEYIRRCNESQHLNASILIDGAPDIAGHGSVRVVPLS